MEDMKKERGEAIGPYFTQTLEAPSIGRLSPSRNVFESAHFETRRNVSMTLRHLLYKITVVW